MAKYIKQGDTIEGDSVGFTVRKWEPGSIVSLPSVKKKMYRYSSSRNSNAIVKQTHSVSNDPEIISATKSYHRNVGDELECSGMKIYVDNFKKVKVSHEGGVTHTHGATLATTYNHTIAIISTPLQCLLKVINERVQKEQLLSKKANDNNL